MKNISQILIPTNTTIEETMVVIQRGSVGIALVEDGQQKLVGTITDGDIRRAILQKADLRDSVALLLSRQPHRPVTARLGTPKELLLQIMKEKVLRQIPLLDEQ